MAETANIAAIATALSDDIFKQFKWRIHPAKDTNFGCNNTEHRSDKDKPKLSHPGDVVFFYEDPYSDQTIFLHTDLKRYRAKTITHSKIREALRSLAMTIECARESDEWRTTYSVDASDSHEVRGMLFVCSGEAAAGKTFGDAIEKINTLGLPVAAGTTIHYMGPDDINRLHAIALDMKVLRGDELLSDDYSFFHPELRTARRTTKAGQQAATIEGLLGPFLILRHASTKSVPQGYIVYYNRRIERTEEALYFLDYLSQTQILESGDNVRIRICEPKPNENYKSIFHQAAARYCTHWRLDAERKKAILGISIDRISVTSNHYFPTEMGWRP